MQVLADELLIATALVLATVVIHLLGLDVLQAVVRWHLRRVSRWLPFDRLTVPIGIVLGLFVLHGLEIWLYAGFYRLAGVLPTLERSLYYAISAYSSLGESGSVLPQAWRIVGVLEAINGMLLIGWSTAFLFHALNHLTWEEDETRLPLPRGAIARGRRG